MGGGGGQNCFHFIGRTPKGSYSPRGRSRPPSGITPFSGTPSDWEKEKHTPPCSSAELFFAEKISMPNMTGRPGHWTMEMNGGSSAPYLACTPCVPLFVHCLIRVETEGLLDYQGRAGIISIVRWNLRPVIFGVENQRFRKGVGGRGLATNKPPKRAQKVLQKCVPLLLRGHRKKGAEKRLESLAFEGFPPTPSVRQPLFETLPKKMGATEERFRWWIWFSWFL